MYYQLLFITEGNINRIMTYTNKEDFLDAWEKAKGENVLMIIGTTPVWLGNERS